MSVVSTLSRVTYPLAMLLLAILLGSTVMSDYRDNTDRGLVSVSVAANGTKATKSIGGTNVIDPPLTHAKTLVCSDEFGKKDMARYHCQLVYDLHVVAGLTGLALFFISVATLFELGGCLGQKPVLIPTRESLMESTPSRVVYSLAVILVLIGLLYASAMVDYARILHIMSRAAKDEIDGVSVSIAYGTQMDLAVASVVTVAVWFCSIVGLMLKPYVERSTSAMEPMMG